jgi:prepilin-type N-terminal cleavage/methylation domain-containing protein
MHPRHGFTLIEILVALTIGATVVLMVHQAFGAMLDSSAALDASRMAHRRETRAREILQEAFGSLEIGMPGNVGFDGSQRQATFTTILPRRAAESQASAVTIAIDGRWLTIGDRGKVDTLIDSPEIVFDYLMSYGAQSSWVQNWHSPASAPLAARLKVRRDSVTVDTLFFLIGPRG